MKEQELKHWWNIFKKRPFLVISIFITSLIIAFTVSTFYYKTIISNKNQIINTKQSIIEDQNLRIEKLKQTIKEKDDQIRDLRQKILENAIKNNTLNITTENENIQTGVIGNWSCTEKDIIMDEFANKINEQDKSLRICINQTKRLLKEKEELEKEIPSYNKGFVGREIKVYKGSTFQADKGRFILSVIDTQALFSTSTYKTTFRLNGKTYTKNLGEFIIFDYYGTNYTIVLKSTNNPTNILCL